MQFDYFHTNEADQYSFYRIPKLLFTDDEFKNISTDAKALYGLFLDRVSLSKKNNWIDEFGHVYIIYTIDEIKQALNCGNKKAVQLVSELENIAHLIEKRRLGLGKPNIIYVKNFSRKVYENGEFKKCQNDTSRNVETTLQEMSKRHSNNTNINNTDISNNLSHREPFFCTLKQTNNGQIDENCRSCYLINSCPFCSRFPSRAEAQDPYNLNDDEVCYLMNQIFLSNPYYNISERIANHCLTDIEKQYYMIDEN